MSNRRNELQNREIPACPIESVNEKMYDGRGRENKVKSTQLLRGKKAIRKASPNVPDRPNKLRVDSNNAIQKLRENGYEVHEFSTSIDEVVAAITQKKNVEGVHLLKKIQDPKFRFVSLGDVENSLAISNSYAVIVEVSRTASLRKAHQAGLKKRQKTADEFAKTMRSIIEKLKDENSLSSYRSVVKALNDKRITTYRGGKWHVQTLQDLEKRWKDLELGSVFNPA
jgi:hypothetical protein